MTLYANGYGNQRLTLEQLVARHGDRLHPEFARRLFAMIEAAGGLVGIGNTYRSTETQAAGYARDPSRFAPPGSSFHELQTFASGLFAVGAADLVGIDGRHTEAWAWVDRHGLRFGIKTFRNVNSEPWHVQSSDLPNSVRRWKAAGRPDPMTWDLEVASVPTTPEHPDDVDPDTDPDTQPRPNPAAENLTEAMVNQLPSLKLGDRGEDVMTVQALVNVRSGTTLATDGIFGPKTDEAVRNVQAWVGITVDGVVGRAETWPTLLLVRQ